MSTPNFTMALTVSGAHGALDARMVNLPLPWKYSEEEYMMDVVEMVRETEVYRYTCKLPRMGMCAVTIMLHYNGTIRVSEQMETNIMFASNVREFFEEFMALI